MTAPTGSSRVRRSCGRLAVIALLAGGCAHGYAGYVPAGAWEPDNDGGHPGLERVVALADSLATTSMMIVHRGRVAAGYGDLTEGGYIASARKSVLAMLYGPYVEDGTVPLDDNLAALGIDDVGGLLHRERTATVRDLLAARSGVYHPAANGGDDTEFAPARGSKAPGSFFLYNNWDFNALGAILERATGRDVFDLLDARLARPLGMQDHDPERHWKAHDTARSVYPAYHMVLSTRDMARIGLLMLRDGRWGDEQIVPADWTRTISRLVTPRADLNPPELRAGPFGYGYLWWVFDDPELPEALHGAYTAVGAFGQFITVIPSLDVVVAHKARVPPYDQEVTEAEYLTLLRAVIDAFH
ncbi:MAG TPA: serine hydrolase [Longimicrobiaceae bacterium]|nr:serine hydrolase [Longimicrobiaceae bacterium]